MNAQSNTQPAAQSYQGWTNYPTWAVNLWMANDEPMYLEALAMAGQAVKDAPDDPNVSEGIWSVEDTAKFRLADSYKDWLTELSELDEASFRSDVFGWAMEQVNWEEIAATWISDAAE